MSQYTNRSASLPLWMLGEDIYFGSNSATAIERARRQRGPRVNRDGAPRHHTSALHSRPDDLKCSDEAVRRLHIAMEAWA